MIRVVHPFRCYQVVICPVFAIACLILALVSDAGLFWIASGLFLILFIIFLIIKLTAKSFNKKKVEFEEEMKTAKRYFGKNREVSKELDDFSEEIGDIERKRKALSSKNAIIWIAIFVVVIIVAALLIFKGNSSSTQEVVNVTTTQEVVNTSI